VPNFGQLVGQNQNLSATWIAWKLHLFGQRFKNQQFGKITINRDLLARQKKLTPISYKAALTHNPSLVRPVHG
jgi:hypothetical protein